MAKFYCSAPFVLLFSVLSFSAQGSTEKILYHLHNTDHNSFRRAITNFENLQKGLPDKQLDIKMLLQGKSIKLLKFSEHNQQLNQRFVNLLNNGVSIEVSRENFYKNQHLFNAINRPDLVQNIFMRIIELQQQGYHYITP